MGTPTAGKMATLHKNDNPVTLLMIGGATLIGEWDVGSETLDFPAYYVASAQIGGTLIFLPVPRLNGVEFSAYAKLGESDPLCRAWREAVTKLRAEASGLVVP